MRVSACELLRLRIPFRCSFAHAQAERSHSDSLLVLLRDERGGEALGEVLPRRYVTGETVESIWESEAPRLARVLLGRRFADQGALVSWIREELARDEWGPALFGGFEGALLGLFDLTSPLDFTALLGPRRRTPPGKCVTVGLETPTEDLHRRTVAARVAGATAIKLKIGGEEDVERIHRVHQRTGGGLALRLDANGGLSYDGARRLLHACRALTLHSLEEPFPSRDPDLEEKLGALRAETGIRLMADESLCRLPEARRWAASGAYQLFNVRVGKCGGLAACAQIIDLARRSEIGLVGGTLVGESAVLGQNSETLLAYCEELPYVEGLGQHRWLLAVDPFEPVPAVLGGRGALRLRKDLREDCLVATREIAA